MDAGTMYANAKALHELLQEERADNAKLVMKLNAEHIVRQNVERENAKLRELCAGLLTGYECGYGELCKGCTWNGLEGDCAARTKARELGVEVDG